MLAGLGSWILIASAITAILYAWDKRAAIKGRQRIPENTLLGLSLAGGWPGGLIASQTFRHKTQKLSFRLRFWACVVINVVLVIGLLWSTR
ncbi:MAG: DUF1294 domain-containing protein [Rubripirellula sp.]